jgi:hypothetical protein
VKKDRMAIEFETRNVGEKAWPEAAAFGQMHRLALEPIFFMGLDRNCRRAAIRPTTATGAKAILEARAA